MTTRVHYYEKLENIKIEVLKMGGLVEESITKAVQSLVTLNQGLAAEVAGGEDVINAAEQKIEDMCVMIIATEQPVAGNLRFVVSTLKAIRDLERCGDYAAHIATVTKNLAAESPVRVPVQIQQMADTCRAMLRDVMKAYAQDDCVMAESVRNKDDIVDSLYLALFKESMADMQANPELVRTLNAMLFAGKSLERLADHIINVCEEVEYICTGTKKDYGV